jgi:hypothetical protein
MTAISMFYLNLEPRSLGAREGMYVSSSDVCVLTKYWLLERRVQDGRVTIFRKILYYFVFGRFVLQPYAANLCVGKLINLKPPNVR